MGEKGQEKKRFIVKALDAKGLQCRKARTFLERGSSCMWHFHSYLKLIVFVSSMEILEIALIASAAHVSYFLISCAIFDTVYDIMLCIMLHVQELQNCRCDYQCVSNQLSNTPCRRS